MDRDRLRTTVLGFALAVVVLGLLAWLVGIDDVLSALGNADAEGIALVVGLVVGWLVAWGLALRRVLSVLDAPISATTGVLLSAGAAFANNVTPFGQAGGEPLTALLVVEIADVPYERGLAAIATVDTVNFVPSVCFALAGLGYLAAEATIGRQLRLAAAAVVALAVVVPAVGLFVWRRRAGLGERLSAILAPIFRRLSMLLPRVSAPSRAALARRIDAFVADIERFAADPSTLALVVAYSALGWLCQIAALWAAFEAIGSPIPLTAAFVAVPVSAVAGATPLPGGAGGIESALVVLLVATPLADVSGAVAFAGVVLFRGLLYWLPTAVGGVVFATAATRRADSVEGPNP